MNLVIGEPCCCRMKRHSTKAIINRWRVSRIPKDSDVTDAKMNRRELVRDMVRMHRSIMVDGIRTITVFLRQYFHTKIDAVCDAAETKYHARPKAIRLELGNSANELIWKEAIEEVLGTDANVELVVNYQPMIQSIAARAYSRTSILLGEEEGANASIAILRRSQELARQVTGINETTRRNLADTIRRSMDEGRTIPEIVKDIRAAVPEISDSRIPTIARTEVSRAIDEGTKERLKSSKSVTHVSVIGCRAREKGSPTWRGESTCNIADVPVQHVDELVFHPNHTGAIVATGFVGDE